MEENEKLEPIAKLEAQEFCLDLEELERLHDESEEEVAKVWKGLPEVPKGDIRDVKQSHAEKGSSHVSLPILGSLEENTNPRFNSSEETH